MAANEREIIIVGAGVIGLSVLYRLLDDIKNTSTKYYITVISNHGPSLDGMTVTYSPHYVSFFAGAHQRPFPSDYKDDSKLTFQRRESLYTLDTFNFFIQKKWNLKKESTIKFVRGYDCLIEPDESYSHFNDGYNSANMKNFVVNDTIDPELIPLEEQANCKLITSYDTYVVNTPLYLSFLLRECCKIAQSSRNIHFKYDFDIKLSSLSEAIIYAQSPNKPLLVNCSGVGLQWASKNPDKDYFPIRGQTLLISIPKPQQTSFFSSPKPLVKFESSTVTHQSGNTWTFVIQRPLPPSHPDFAEKLYFIVGGTKQPLSTSLSVSEFDTATLLKNSQQIYPTLFQKGWKLERENVGLRPALKGGSRVSLQHYVCKGEPFACVNAFGFAGYGVETSMGAAFHALSLIKRGFREGML